MAENKMTLQIISPDRVFYEGEVTMFEMNTTEGEVGVYPGHIPIVNVLKPGIVVIHEGEKIRHAAVHDGFSEILPDRITVMAEIAEWPEEIDKERALSAKERAAQRIAQKTNGVDMARAEAALRRALTRIELVERYK